MTIIPVHQLSRSEACLLGNNVVDAIRNERRSHFDGADRSLAALGEQPVWLNDHANVTHKSSTRRS